MSFKVLCPCGAKLNVKDELSGKQGKCPSCKRNLNLLPHNSAPRPTNPLPSGIDAATTWLGKTWPTWAIVLGLLGWLVFANSMSRAVPLLSYPCIAFVGAGITARCTRKYTWRWTKLTGILLTVTAVYLWGRYDTYNSEWVHDNVRYTDTYKRWGGQHIYRVLHAFETPEAAAEWRGIPNWSARGPITETGKVHGKWSYTYWKPDFHIETKFFWYGEEISEGEWHLRN